jgi:hypothetical protein
VLDVDRLFDRTVTTADTDTLLFDTPRRPKHRPTARHAVGTFATGAAFLGWMGVLHCAGMVVAVASRIGLSIQPIADDRRRRANLKQLRRHRHGLTQSLPHLP